MRYNKNILISCVVVSYFDKKIYVTTKSSEIKRSLKLTLNELFIDEVSGNISWEALDIIEGSKNLYLIFLGPVGWVTVASKYEFRKLDNKLTKVEQLAVENLSSEVGKFNPKYLRPMLGEKFLIRDLFELYRTLVDKKKDRANFYKMIHKNGHIVPVGRRKMDVFYRPPEYFRIMD